MHDFPDVSAPRAHGVATYPPGASFGPRALADWELVWVIEGEAEYQRAGDAATTSTTAAAGSVVLCRPCAAGETDSFRWDRRRPTRHAYAHFEVRSTPAHWPAAGDWPVVRALGPEESAGDVIRPVFRHLLTWAGRPAADAGLLRMSVAHLLAAFVLGQCDAAGVRRGALPEPVELALGHVAATLDADPSCALSLGDLAAAAFVTPEHLCRLFRASVGRSPLTTVRLARLDRAAVLLARSNEPVNRVAAWCGFASPFHFSRAFKSAFGVSPRGLRDDVRCGVPPRPQLIDLRPGV